MGPSASLLSMLMRHRFSPTGTTSTAAAAVVFVEALLLNGANGNVDDIDIAIDLDTTRTGRSCSGREFLINIVPELGDSGVRVRRECCISIT
jgi:hypothetical protein